MTPTFRGFYADSKNSYGIEMLLVVFFAASLQVASNQGGHLAD
jgi:hypothetical protein